MISAFVIKPTRRVWAGKKSSILLCQGQLMSRVTRECFSGNSTSHHDSHYWTFLRSCLQQGNWVNWKFRKTSHHGAVTSVTNPLPLPVTRNSGLMSRMAFVLPNVYRRHTRIISERMNYVLIRMASRRKSWRWPLKSSAIHGGGAWQEAIVAIYSRSVFVLIYKFHPD